MASRSLGTLTLNMVARTAGFREGMSKAERASDQWRKKVEHNARIATKAMGAAAAAVGASMVGLIKSQLDSADNASKVAQRIGIATEKIAGLQLSFELGGSSAEAMQTSLVKLADQAQKGNEAFAKMGVSVRDAGGGLKDTRTLIAEVADAFQDMPNNAEKTALAYELFGRQGAELIPILNAGAEGFADMDAKAQELGLTLDTETGKRIEEFNDRMSLMGKRLAGMGLRLTEALLPAMSAVLDIIEQVGSFIGDHFNDILLVSIGAFTAFASSAGLVTGAINNIGIAFKAVSALFMANPFVIVVTAVVGLIVYFDKAKEALFVLKEAASFVSEAISVGFSAAADVAVTSFKWIWDNAAAAVSGITSIFGDGLGWITSTTGTETSNWWSSFSTFFDDTGTGFWGILEKAAKVFDAIGALIRSFVTYGFELMKSFGRMVSNIWDNIKLAILKSVEGFINGIIEGINAVADTLGMDTIGKISLGGGEYKDVSFEAPSFSEVYDVQASIQQANGLHSAIQGVIDRYKEAHKAIEKTNNEIERTPKWDPPTPPTGGGGKAHKGAAKAAKQHAEAEETLAEVTRQITETQREYNQLVQSLETDDEKRLRTLTEQLDVIKAMQSQHDNGIAGAASQQSINETRSRAISSAFGMDDAPDYFKDFDNGFLEPYFKVEEQRAELQEWYEERLEMLETSLEAGLLLEQEYAEKSAEIHAHLAEQKKALAFASQDAMLQAGEAVFGELSEMAKTYAGEQSGIYRAMFAVEKAFAIARASVAIQQGIAQAAANPFPQNLAAMASVTSATGSIISTLMGIQAPSGMAHDGIDKVPKDGTWLLQKGERVTTAKTSAKLDATLNEIRNNKKESAPANTQNIRIVNSVDPKMMESYLGSDDGERLILNIIGNNPSIIKQAVGA